MYDSDTASQLFKGKSYNHGVRGHKLTMEAMFCLEFNKWLKSDQESEALKSCIKTAILNQIKSCKLAIIQNLDNLSMVFDSFVHIFHLLVDYLIIFGEKEGSCKKCIMGYLYIGEILLRFIRA